MSNYVTEIITISAEEVKESKKTLRRTIQFPTTHGDSVSSVRIYEVGSKANEYSLGLSADSGPIQEPTYKEEWLRTTESTREKPLDIVKIAGKNLYLNFVSEAAFVDNLELHIVFKTENTY